MSVFLKPLCIPGAEFSLFSSYHCFTRTPLQPWQFSEMLLLLVALEQSESQDEALENRIAISVNAAAFHLPSKALTDAKEAPGTAHTALLDTTHTALIDTYVFVVGVCMKKRIFQLDHKQFRGRNYEFGLNQPAGSAVHCWWSCFPCVCYFHWETWDWRKVIGTRLIEFNRAFIGSISCRTESVEPDPMRRWRGEKKEH